jgi:Helicase associated domain
LLTVHTRTGIDNFQLLCAFQREHGHCRVPRSLEIDSVELGRWVNSQRYYYKNCLEGKIGHVESITEERIAQLDGVEFEWSIYKATVLNEKVWQRKFQLLCAFEREHGHCRFPKSCVSDSVKLGHWVNTQRKYYKYHLEENIGAGASITVERFALLNGIGFEWSIHEETGFDEKGWQHKFQMLCEFQRDDLYNHNNKPPPAAPTFPARSSVLYWGCFWRASCGVLFCGLVNT